MNISGYEKTAHLYDIFDQKKNIEFFYHYAGQSGAILDIGSGTGRIAIPLAERGIKVYCVEPSSAMVREFKKKLLKRPELLENIKLMEGGDAKSFRFARKFPAAFLSGTFDHFLDDEERKLSLSNINRHLKSEGKLVFDIYLDLMKEKPISPAGEYEIGDRLYRRFVGGKIIPGNKKKTTLIFEIYQSGKLVERIEECALVGITDRKHIHQLLSENGFEVVKEFNNFDFTEFKPEDDLLIIEAIKH